MAMLQTILNEFATNIQSPLAGLVLQILVILIVARLCGVVLKAFGQTQVIGEMIAGVVLGKSVLGALSPTTFSTLFPESTMPRLFMLSQVGLILFMFVVGLDLKVAELKKKALSAVAISQVSIAVPFALGALLAIQIYDTFGPNNFNLPSFALFMGIAVSVTAFPVLARIIQEKNLNNTQLGNMALTCAAISDVTAWCILAAILGVVRAGSFLSAIATFSAVAIYSLLMLKVAKPVLARVLRPVMINGEFSRTQLSIVFCFALASAMITETIGIHALFGAFFAGAIMPQNISFRSSLIEKIEDLSAVVLLPIFFAYTGLRMQVGFLDSWSAWSLCLGIIALATIGKVAGSAIPAKISGMSWRESLALGSLMNTRGLMELVVLNIGYDIGILSPTLFAMLVVMAIVTTMMTSPLLSLFVAQKEKGSELSPLPSKN